MTLAAYFPARVRRFLLALAEVGHEANRDLKLPLLAKQRSVFIDVGANRGQFARFMSSFYDHVIVFEPVGRFVEELKSILPSNCTIHRCALADFTGPATFFMPTEADPSTVQTASLVSPGADIAHNQVTVDVKRLDDFGLADVSFIKVDVEGAEYAFLQGAVATLERCRPSLLIEIEDRHTNGQSKRVFDFLHGIGYRAFVQEQQAERSTASAYARVFMGVSYLVGKDRIKLTPVTHLLEDIYREGRSVNEAFGGYVNNFVFVPNQSPIQR